jgi:hypothetical protein
VNPETVEELTKNLVRAASNVLEMFQNGHHPTESQLKRLEGALFPFFGEKLCGHKIVEECDCSEMVLR